MFLAFAVIDARPLNCSVTKLIVGVPSSSNVVLAWIHHAVHDPQLPKPEITASTLWLNPSSWLRYSLGTLADMGCT